MGVKSPLAGAPEVISDRTAPQRDWAFAFSKPEARLVGVPNPRKDTPSERNQSYQELIAAIGTIVFNPSTPVEATPWVMLPSHDLPIIAAAPVDHEAGTAEPPETAEYPVARPFSQSITALPDATSDRPPVSMHPVDRDEPLK